MMKKTVLFAILCELYITLAKVNTPHLCLPPPSQKCFTIIDDQQLNWLKAEEYCEKNLPNGRLACVHNAFAGSLISGWLPFLTTDPWIGAFRVGSRPYEWVDNTPLDYSNWAPGQPTGPCAQVCHMAATNPGDSCLQGKWRTAECENIISQFICEYGNYTSAPISTTTQPPLTAADCLALHQQYPTLSNGIYLLSPPGIDPFYAYCDMETDGGGWTVIQRRIDGILSFYDKTWNEYKHGFNNGLDKNLWLGNEKIHILSTKDANVELRIDVWGDRAPNSSHSNIYLWLKQSSFSLASEDKLYYLRLNSSVEGNASISGSPYYGINYNIGFRFSTVDNSNDACHGCCNQSPYLYGGWWLADCTYSSLNGKYVPVDWGQFYDFQWSPGYFRISPAQSRMMIRKVT